MSTGMEWVAAKIEGMAAAQLEALRESCSGYISFEHAPDTVLLDGDFTVSDLDRLVNIMRLRGME